MQLSMLKRQISLHTDSIRIRNKRIPFDEIVGIKEWNDTISRKISPRFPRAELFLKNGKTVSISATDEFRKSPCSQMDKDVVAYDDAIDVVRRNSFNINRKFSNWLEWRLIVPAGLLEVIAFVLGILLMDDLGRVVNGMILAGLLGVPIGWIWERRARIRVAGEPRRA